MKKNIVSIILTMVLITLLNACNAKKQNNVLAEEDILVKVNDEYILESEIRPVFEQYVDTDVTFEKILEDTIKEILVIQQSEDLAISVSESEVDNILTEFKHNQTLLYNEALALYGEQTLRSKIYDKALFDKVKQYVLLEKILLEDFIINKFKNQPELNGYLDNQSNDNLRRSLRKELSEFAFMCWIESLRDEAEIVYYR